MARIAIVAALAREVASLVRGAGWRRTKLGRRWRVFESDTAVVVCAGIGAAPARAAAEAVVANAKPGLLISAGLAGGLVPGWQVAQVMIPSVIVGATSRRPVFWLGEPEDVTVDGVLFSASEVVGTKEKTQLSRQYGAQAVDMEAEAVAEVAERSKIPFLAVKAICDEWDFLVPDLAAYVDRQGRFRTFRFVLHTAFRPYSWRDTVNLASRSARASQALSRKLRGLLESGALDAISGPKTSPWLAAAPRVE